MTNFFHKFYVKLTHSFVNYNVSECQEFSRNIFQMSLNQKLKSTCKSMVFLHCEPHTFTTAFTIRTVWRKIIKIELSYLIWCSEIRLNSIRSSFTFILCMRTDELKSEGSSVILFNRFTCLKIEIFGNLLRTVLRTFVLIETNWDTFHSVTVK